MNKILGLLLFTIQILNVTAQKGVEFGLGSGVIIPQDENIKTQPIDLDMQDFRLKSSVPLYFDFKMNYKLNSKWSINSGLNCRLRNISIMNGSSDFKTMVSLPLMLNYHLLPFKYKKLGLNVLGGFSIDKNLISKDEKSITIVNDYSVISSKTNDYLLGGGSILGSLRFGMEIERIINKQRLGFQFLYVHQLGKRLTTISNLKHDVFYDLSRTELDYTINETLDARSNPSGIQIGINYYLWIQKKNDHK